MQLVHRKQSRAIIIITRNTFYETCICPMRAVVNPIIQTSTFQGHPAS